MPKPQVGQIWKMKGDTYKDKYVFITEILARYAGKMSIGFDVRFKSVELLDEHGSAVRDVNSFKEYYEWISG